MSRRPRGEGEHSRPCRAPEGRGAAGPAHPGFAGSTRGPRKARWEAGRSWGSEHGEGRGPRVSRPVFHVTHIPPACSLQQRGSPAPRMTGWPASSAAVSASAQPRRPLGVGVPQLLCGSASPLPPHRSPPLCPSPAPPPHPRRGSDAPALEGRGLSRGTPAAPGSRPGRPGLRPPCWGDRPGGWAGPGPCPAGRSEPLRPSQVWTRLFCWNVLVTDFPSPQKTKRQRRR